MIARSLGAVLLLFAVAAGCTSETTKPSSVPQTSAPSRTGASVSTTTTTTTPPTATTNSATGQIGELRAKLVPEGICEQLAEFTPLLPVRVTGLLNCEDGYGIFTFPTTTERDEVIFKIIDNPCGSSTFVAVADTWLVLPNPGTETRAGRIAEILGGEVRELPCPRG